MRARRRPRQHRQRLRTPARCCCLLRCLLVVVGGLLPSWAAAIQKDGRRLAAGCRRRAAVVVAWMPPAAPRRRSSSSLQKNASLAPQSGLLACWKQRRAHYLGMRRQHVPAAPLDALVFFSPAAAARGGRRAARHGDMLRFA